MFLFTSSVFIVLLHVLCNKPVAKCGAGNPLSIRHRQYYSGDLLIAGVISQIYRFSELMTFRRHPSAEHSDELMFFSQNYQHILALTFAVQEINANSHILPNITLGIHVFNNYFMARWTYLASMELLSTHGRFIPNYKCDDKDNTVSVIVGPNPQFCQYVASILNLYKVPQIIYGSAPVMNNNAQAASLHQMFPNEYHQNEGILHLLLNFKWTWVGVVYIAISWQAGPILHQWSFSLHMVDSSLTTSVTTRTRQYLSLQDLALIFVSLWQQLFPFTRFHRQVMLMKYKGSERINHILRILFSL
nr:PREDICTED: vomeronasal type-2 receptor 26-like isoform X2 [Anolis carolinensis]|eukprot:XP_016850867.1 PREDICTED: vomeronasal type-2 receptor 26-like isoform X2 [Anolis carolinensis]